MKPGPALDEEAEDRLPAAPEGTPEECIFDAPDLIELSYKGIYPYELDFYDHFLGELDASPSATRVLELGAGFGRIAIPLAHRGYRVVALERHPVMLSELHQRSDRLGAALDIIEGDMRRFSLPGERFDAVLCPLGIANALWSEASALSHWQSVSSCLRAGGLAIHVLSAATAGPRIMPHAASWECRDSNLRVRTDFEFHASSEPPADQSFAADLAEFDHRLSAFDGTSWRLLRWRGRMRVYTPNFVEHLLSEIPELELAGWYRMFDATSPLDAPRDEDAVAVLVLRRK